MKKLSVLLVVVLVLVFSLTACGGGDKNQVTTVSEGDVSTCLALNGPDVSAWAFSPLEKLSNNVCYVYQTTR